MGKIRSAFDGLTRIDPLTALLFGGTLVGWATVAQGAQLGIVPLFCGSIDYGSKVVHAATLAWALASPFELAVSAIAMALFMTPLMSAPLRHIYARSFSALRPAAILLFVLGFLGTWALGNMLIAGVAAIIRLALFQDGSGAALGLIIAAGWHLSPWKQRSLNRCHRRPSLAAFGFAAIRSATAFGCRSAMWCIANCWALMLLSLLLGAIHHLAMASGIVFLVIERLYPPSPAHWRVPLTAYHCRKLALYRGFEYDARSRTEPTSDGFQKEKWARYIPRYRGNWD